MPTLSLITSFRDRDTQRVERFLASLASQTDPDFELIFLDYGSQQDTATAIRELCERYPFCKYVYNHTRGMVWNRAHAMNSAVRFAGGEFVLFTDIDLIFSAQCVARLKRAITPGNQYFCRAYFLPREFKAYDTLASCPTNFRLTRLKTRGLFHCVARAAFEEGGGFDEYFCIWGLEDTQLAMHLRNAGLRSVWLDSAEAPIYHQWHPSSALLSDSFPPKWWETMTIHAALSSATPGNFANRGQLLTASDRPCLREPVTTEIRIPSELEPPGRGRAIQDIIFFLQNYPGKVLKVRIKASARHEIDLRKQSRNRTLS
ncbi:MAG: glycosyltransferase, partial [Saprospiraceae bacterium]|nr:glycosyltransferase [Saprospiraceae bacterium]